MDSVKNVFCCKDGKGKENEDDKSEQTYHPRPTKTRTLTHIKAPKGLAARPDNQLNVPTTGQSSKKDGQPTVPPKSQSKKAENKPNVTSGSPGNDTKAKPTDGGKAEPTDGGKTKSKGGEKSKPRDGAKAKSKGGEKSKPGDGAKAKSKEGEKSKPRDGAKAKSKGGGKSKPRDGAEAKPTDGEKRISLNQSVAPSTQNESASQSTKDQSVFRNSVNNRPVSPSAKKSGVVPAKEKSTRPHATIVEPPPRHIHETKEERKERKKSIAQTRETTPTFNQEHGPVVEKQNLVQVCKSVMPKMSAIGEIDDEEEGERLQELMDDFSQMSLEDVEEPVDFLPEIEGVEILFFNPTVEGKAKDAPAPAHPTQRSSLTPYMDMTTYQAPQKVAEELGYYGGTPQPTQPTVYDATFMAEYRRQLHDNIAAQKAFAAKFQADRAKKAYTNWAGRQQAQQYDRTYYQDYQDYEEYAPSEMSFASTRKLFGSLSDTMPRIRRTRLLINNSDGKSNPTFLGGPKSSLQEYLSNVMSKYKIDPVPGVETGTAHGFGLQLEHVPAVLDPVYNRPPEENRQEIHYEQQFPDLTYQIHQELNYEQQFPDLPYQIHQGINYEQQIPDLTQQNNGVQCPECGLYIPALDLHNHLENHRSQNYQAYY